MTLIDKAEALLPCPFCGAAFKMGQEPHDSPYVGGFFYLYHDYGPLGSEARKCPISVNGHYETAELAIAAWNRRAALPARGVGVKPDAAEMLAKEMQAIVAADRWKGRDLSAAPPEKWSHLRPETQQFWIDTATRILAALSPAPAPTDAAQAREAAQVQAALDNKEQLDIWVQEILEGLAFADVLKIESYDDKIEAHSVIGRGIVEVLRALIGERK